MHGACQVRIDVRGDETSGKPLLVSKCRRNLTDSRTVTDRNSDTAYNARYLRLPALLGINSPYTFPIPIPFPNSRAVGNGIGIGTVYGRASPQSGMAFAMLLPRDRAV